MKDCNKTAASHRAGYKSGTSCTNVLNREDVRAYVDEQLEKIHCENIADATEVMEYLTSVMRGEKDAEVVVVTGTGDGCSEARNIIKKPDQKEKLKAAELLGKRFGLYKENINITNSIPVVITEDELQ